MSSIMWPQNFVKKIKTFCLFFHYHISLSLYSSVLTLLTSLHSYPSLRVYDLFNLQLSSPTRLTVTSTVANPPSLLSWPQQHQPSPSSTPFSAVASTVPDHSSTAGISTPDYMLGLRNTIFLPQPPSQITQPSRNSNVEVEKVCKDCGNRAKKECLFERCRTCCKSRGYNCATHVKSTWVPSSAASRSSSSSSDRNKKLKLVSSDKPKSFLIVPTTTTSRHHETNFKEGLPGKIEAPAVFRRTRVTAVSNDEQSEIGYQATVTKSGHVFKGFLHYYGVDHNKAFPCLSNK